jgi:hypothetical protein
MSEILVSQLINANGNANANQFILHYNSNVTNKPYVAFQSYDSRVCEIATEGGLGFRKVVTFGRDYNYSKTTSKHLNEFLIQNGLSCLASAKDRHEAIERGHARMDETIAVRYDETLY